MSLVYHCIRLSRSLAAPRAFLYTFSQPENLDSNVALLFDWMEMDTGTIVEVLEPDADAPPLPPGLFVGQMLPLATLVKQHLDIRGQPARYLFELLANFTPSEMEVSRMEWKKPRIVTTSCRQPLCDVYGLLLLDLLLRLDLLDRLDLSLLLDLLDGLELSPLLGPSFFFPASHRSV